MNKKIACTGCGKQIDIFETFPGDCCVVCHAKVADNMPLGTAEELAAQWRNVVDFKKIVG